MLNKIIDFSLRQRFVALSLVTLMAAGGVGALLDLPINSLPDVTPVQVLVIPVSAKFAAYAREVHDRLLDAGLRAEGNLKDDRVGYKIREASLQKIPFVIVVGEREAQHGTVNPRERDEGELGEMQLDEFLRRTGEG